MRIRIDDGYLNNRLAAGISPNTLRIYGNRLLSLQRVVGELEKASLEDLEQFLAKNRHLASETRKSYRAAFRSYYSWLMKTGQILENPAAELESIPVKSPPPRAVSDSQIISALASASDREIAMILLGRLACLRLSEITNLHMSDRKDKLLTIKGKGEKWRIVPINKELMPALKRLESTLPHGYYFPSEIIPGQPLHPMSVNKIITRVLGSNPHSLRHAGAAAAYRKTKDLRALQLLLGHSSISTTQRYLGLDFDAVVRAAAATEIAV